MKRYFTPKDLCLIALFAALTSVGGWIKIPLPFSPVPLTLQTLFVLLSGLLIGSIRGAFSQIVYVAVGCAGLPVFAGFQGGIGIVLGPTGGYLIGFIIAAYITGLISERIHERTVITDIISTIPGFIIIFIIGSLYMGAITGMGFIRSLLIGVLPFLPGGLLKIICAGFISARIRKIHKRL